MGPLCGMKSVPCLRSIYTVRRIWRKYGIVGISKHRSLGRGARGLSATVACIIRAWCRKPGGKRRGTRLSKLRKFLQMNPVVNRSVPRCTLCRWLKRLGLTRKKGTRVALQQDPVKVALFWTKLQLLDVDVDEAVFFDESGINTDDWNMYYGYSEKGTRFYTEERVGRGERINCLVSVCTSRTGLFRAKTSSATSNTTSQSTVTSSRSSPSVLVSPCCCAFSRAARATGIANAGPPCAGITPTSGNKGICGFYCQRKLQRQAQLAVTCRMPSHV